MHSPIIKPKSLAALSLLIGSLILAAALKIWLVVGGYVPFNSDEAVVALMARHILQGESPVFFYGQAYMGSLDAFLVAGGFKLFGEQVWVIRLIQGLLYLGTLVTTAWIGSQVFASWWVGALAALLMAIPTVNVTLYTTASLGGYGEALLIGNLILLSGIRIAKQLEAGVSQGSTRAWLALGFLIGLGLWAFGLALVYAIPVVIFLLVQWIRWLRRNTPPHTPLAHQIGSLGSHLALLLFGFFIGSTPWWWFAAQHGIAQLLQELGGGAIAGVEGLPWILQVGKHTMSLILLGVTVIFGFRPPWDVTWLAFPLLPFVFMFWMAILVHISRSICPGTPGRSPRILLVGVMLTLVLAFILTPFGADPSGRYFLPLAMPMSLFAAEAIFLLRNKVGQWVYALVGLLLIYHLWGTIQCIRRFPPGITTQFYAPSQIDHRYDDELIAFLRINGERFGYTNYWVSYPLAFLSQEELIFVPRLPYHLDFRYTERDDRYKPYDELVNHSPHVAYITTNHPELDRHLRQSFASLGVAWQEIQIGDFHVFYALSRVVRPEEMRLGRTTVP